MKRLARALLVLALIVGVGWAVLDLVVVPAINSGAVHREIESRLTDAAERDVHFENMHIDLFPPSIVIEDLRVAAADPKDPPLIQDGEVELYVAPLPLLRWAIVIDSFSMKRSQLRIVRTRDGIEQGLISGPDETRFDEVDRDLGEEAKELVVDFAVQRMSLLDVVLRFEDRTFDPPVVWSIADVDGVFETEGAGRPYDASLEVEMEGGGRLESTGTIRRDGTVDAKIVATRFPSFLVTRYIGAVDHMEGTFSGAIELEGPAADPDPIDFDLTWHNADLAIDELHLEGTLTVSGTMTGGIDDPQLRFKIDATEASLGFEGVYDKAPGNPGTLEGRLFQGEGGKIEIELDAVRIRNLKGSGRIDLGERLVLELEAQPFEIDPWLEDVPILAELEPSGVLEIHSLLVRTHPLEVDGRVGFAPIHLPLPEAGSVTLRGDVVGEGDTIRADGLELVLPTETVPIEGHVSDLGGAWSYRVAVDVHHADANRAVSAVAGRPSVVHGPLDFAGDLSGELAGERSFVDSLDGHVAFRIEHGELQGVSFLEATFSRFPKSGAGLLRMFRIDRLTQPVTSVLSPYYGDDFRLLAATLDIADGVATTRDFRLRTSSYDLELQGRIHLHGMTLDAKGNLRLGNELSRSVTRVFGVSRLPGLGGLNVPLTRIEGTLGDPQVTPEWDFFLRAVTGNIPLLPDLMRVLPGRGGR